MDKTIYGSALHQRTMAGLLFANVGLAERIEVSRKTVLSACARMAMLRPKLLEQMKVQLKGVASIQDDEVMEALLLQPRGGEIIMDFTIGASHTISTRNREQLVDALRRGLTAELVEQHQKEIDDATARAIRDREQLAGEVNKRERVIAEIQDELQTLKKAAFLLLSNDLTPSRFRLRRRKYVEYPTSNLH